jgi:uncharacterized protein involved in tolerance to divalent cations
MIKSRRDLFAAIRRDSEIHSYEVPEVIAIRNRRFRKLPGVARRELTA